MTPFEVLEIFDWVLDQETKEDYLREPKHFVIAKRALARMQRVFREETIRKKFQTLDDAIEHLCLAYVRSSKFNKFGANPSACFSEDTFRRWRQGLLYGKNN